MTKEELLEEKRLGLCPDMLMRSEQSIQPLDAVGMNKKLLCDNRVLCTKKGPVANLNGNVADNLSLNLKEGLAGQAIKTLVKAVDTQIARKKNINDKKRGGSRKELLANIKKK